MSCIDVLVMSSAYIVSFTGACGVGVSDVYMLKSVDDRTTPCGTPVLNCRLVSACGVCLDVVCDEFENGLWDVWCSLYVDGVECFGH